MHTTWRTEPTVACALGHLQVEVFAGFVFLAHVVIEAYQRLAAVQARRAAGAEWSARKFAVGRCASDGVLKERGAGEVG
jgi:hypothetical protein